MCNLCTSRLGFLITCLAALRNRCLLVLPPSGGNADLAAVLDASARPLVVGDAEAWPDPWQGDPAACRRPGAAEPERQATCGRAHELAWQPAWDDDRGALYTSGSTGAPEPQPKTLRHLAPARWPSAPGSRARLDGGLAAIERIVCSVPPQHMFGLECSVMLPLVHGIAGARSSSAAAGRRPRGVRRQRRRGAWIATPMHLRSLVAVGPKPAALPRRHRLDHAAGARRRAAQRAALLPAPVLEIYGSTETGALAHAPDRARVALAAARRRAPRSTATAATLAARRALRFAGHAPRRPRLDAGRLVHAARPARRPGQDRRSARLARAASTCCCRSCPAWTTACSTCRPAASPTERLCLIHSGPPLDRAAARRWLRGAVDPVFLPRAFHPPRAAAAQRRRQAAPRGARPGVRRLACRPRSRSAEPSIRGRRASRRCAAQAQRSRAESSTGTTSMTIVEGEGRARQRLADPPHRLARARRRPAVCRALLYPIVLYFVAHRRAPRVAHRASSSPRRRGRAGRLGRCLRAHPLLRRDPARPRLHGQRRLRSLRGHRATATRWSPTRSSLGQGLRPARLASRQLRSDDR